MSHADDDAEISAEDNDGIQQFLLAGAEYVFWCYFATHSCVHVC